MNIFVSVFHHLQKDKQRKQRQSLKLGKKRRQGSKHNYYIISPRVITKAIIINKEACGPPKNGKIALWLGTHNIEKQICGT